MAAMPPVSTPSRCSSASASHAASRRSSSSRTRSRIAASTDRQDTHLRLLPETAGAAPVEPPLFIVLTSSADRGAVTRARDRYQSGIHSGRLQRVAQQLGLLERHRLIRVSVEQEDRGIVPRDVVDR